jgi:hypothetical protein
VDFERSLPFGLGCKRRMGEGGVLGDGRVEKVTSCTGKRKSPRKRKAPHQNQHQKSTFDLLCPKVHLHVENAIYFCPFDVEIRNLIVWRCCNTKSSSLLICNLLLLATLINQ